MAGKLEQHFPMLGDALTSTVSFLQGNGQRATGNRQRPIQHSALSTQHSKALVRRVIEDTARTVRELPLEGALTLRPLARCVLIGLLVGIILLAIYSPLFQMTQVIR